jgi:nicotinamide-nucleotide amidase
VKGLAVLICVGDELLDGRVQDANSAYLTKALQPLGWKVSLVMTVGDDIGEISSALRYAMGKGQLIVITGGLGPTADDLTREGVAAALGRGLEQDGSIVRRLHQRFAAMGREMPPSNLRQAQVIEGTVEVIEGKGTAPGLGLKEGDTRIYLLPGVPGEMRDMMERHILRSLGEEGGGGKRPLRSIRLFGCTEAAAGEIVESLLPGDGSIKASYLAEQGEIAVTVWGTGEGAGVEESLEALVKAVEKQFKGMVISAEGLGLPETVSGLMGDRGATLTVAESCTGGMLGERITRVPGSSSFFLGGVISYSVKAKASLLGVPPGLVESKGVVSQEVARAMARGARRLLGSDFALSTTGVAGPSGGTEDAPVGTVCIALADEEGEKSRELRLPGDREMIRCLAVNAALMMLTLHLRGEDVG